MRSKELKRKHIVIIGGGFGGAYAAQRLERKLHSREYEIILIDRHNYFIFYPLLIEAGTGNLEPRHAVVSLRSFLKRTTFIMGNVQNIDLHKNVLEYQATGTNDMIQLALDHLVLALGSITSLPPIPGLDRLAFGMKTLSDAVTLRDRAIQLLERANITDDREERKKLLRFVVVGANFTGVEVAGEFDVFLKEASKKYDNVSPEECSIVLVEMTDQILTAVNDPDLAQYAAEKLKKRGVGILTNNTIKHIYQDHVDLNDGNCIDTHTVIWCAGIAPNPLLEKADLPTDKRGYVLCENSLRVEGYEHIWAIGDCAVNPDPQGHPYPATAQHAVAQGHHLAENLSRAVQNQPLSPVKLSSKGVLAALGCRTAVAKVFGIKLSGFPAWFLWRTVYLMKMPGWSRRIRIALDWTMDLFFKRDYVQLGVHEDRH